MEFFKIPSRIFHLFFAMARYNDAVTCYDGAATHGPVRKRVRGLESIPSGHGSVSNDVRQMSKHDVTTAKQQKYETTVIRGK